MLEFRKQKKILVPVLVALGLVGLVLPIIPGLVLLALAAGLVWPGHEWKIGKSLSKLFGYIFGSGAK